MENTNITLSGSTSSVTANSLGIPEIFNAADYFIDRNILEGRGSKTAIAFQDQQHTYDWVKECCGVGKEDHDQMIKPKAFVVLNKGIAASNELAENLKVFVRELIAEYKRPRWIEFVQELPRTTTGKLQRFKLR